jgi:hypothetical protein
MLVSTNSVVLGQPSPADRKFWEDPCLTLERALEVSAQGGRPPTGGGPEFRPDRGFLGPLGTSGGTGSCF